MASFAAKSTKVPRTAVVVAFSSEAMARSWPNWPHHRCWTTLPIFRSISSLVTAGWKRPQWSFSLYRKWVAGCPCLCGSIKYISKSSGGGEYWCGAQALPAISEWFVPHRSMPVSPA